MKLFPKVITCVFTGICAVLLFSQAIHADTTAGADRAQTAPFSDSATFKFLMKGVPIGTITNSMDEHGEYVRKTVLSISGQSVEMTMNVKTDERGAWTSMEIVNPTFADYQVKREGNTAIYLDKGIERKVELPGDAVLYDDYGVLYESLVLQKYDRDAKGVQAFARFRVPEVPVPGNVVQVRLEYLGERNFSLNGKQGSILLFQWIGLGTTAVYYVDSQYRILMIDAPQDQQIVVREGYEDLLKSTAEDTLARRSLSETTLQTVNVPMRDGVGLSTDLYMPKDPKERIPVILIRTPYHKKDHEYEGRYFAARGYAVAVQDVRGRFGSPGKWVPLVNEAADGYDSIEWLSSQKWSSGKVGMLGGSYLALAQVLAAKMKPPHLVTIIPHNLPSDPFSNGPYEYGAFLLAPQLWWTNVVESNITAGQTQKLNESHRLKEDPNLSSLPVIDLDQKILGKKVPFWRDWIQHAPNSPFWDQLSYLDSMKEFGIPIFFQTGWFDTQAIGTKLAYAAHKKTSNQPANLLIGPWDHVNQIPQAIATRNVGPESSVDRLELFRRWFDFWLLGKDCGTREPPVQIYVLNAGHWLKSEAYPLPQTQFTKLFLSSERGAATLKGDGRLLWDQPSAARKFDEYCYDPADPTPAPPYRFKEGRKSFDEITSRRADILVYQSEPLEKPITIAGPISAKLYASTSAPDTDWFVTLYALTEKGEHVPMVRGVVRARYRNSLVREQRLEKNLVHEYNIDLWHFAVRLEKGWSLRVEVTSAYFPIFSRNLNTGGRNEMETRSVPATQRVFHDVTSPTHILLPVIPEEE